MSDPFDPPDTPPGSEIVEYSVGLRVPQPDRGFWDTGGSYMIPRFRARCVCCNVETPETKGYDPGESNQLTGKFDVPVCPDCYFHIGGGRFWQGMLALAGGIGGAVAIFGVCGWAFMEAGPGMLLIGLAGLGLGGAGYAFSTWRAVRSARFGHHSMFECWVAPGFTGIRTTNRRLVDDLLALHGAAATIDHETPR